MGNIYTSSTTSINILYANQSFCDIYKRYWHSLYQMAWKRLKSKSLANETIEKVFTSLWNQKELLRIEDLEGWLKEAVKTEIFKLIAEDKVGSSFYKNMEAPKLTFVFEEAI